jgi:hypothetical protein
VRFFSIRRSHPARNFYRDNGESPSVPGHSRSGRSHRLFGGVMAAFNIAISALVLWVMAYPGMANESGVLRALYYIVFAVGGVGFSVPMGLLIAGISIPALMIKLLPKWLIVLGW